MLKIHHSEKKQPVLPKCQNGSLPTRKVKKDGSKSLSKSKKTDSAQRGAGNKVDKTVFPTVDRRDAQTNLKFPIVSEKSHSSVPKRKKDSGESNCEPKVKVKKTVVKNEKPTE